MGALIVKGLFDDDDILLKSVKKVRTMGLHIEEVYTPFPVHGLEKAMGLKDTRLAICAFLYGLCGLTIAILMTNYMMIQDWPQDIGGKPSFSWLENMPAFVPIMFELTVFCAAHLMVITFYLRSKLYPGSPAANPDKRTTDDKFLMELLVIGEDKEKAKQALIESGAIEISVKHANDH